MKGNKPLTLTCVCSSMQVDGIGVQITRFTLLPLQVDERSMTIAQGVSYPLVLETKDPDTTRVFVPGRCYKLTISEQETEKEEEDQEIPPPKKVSRSKPSFSTDHSGIKGTAANKRKR